MRDFFRSRKFKVIVCIAAFLIGLMLYAGVKLSNEPGMNIFHTIFGPIEKFSSNISSKVEASLDMFINAKVYYEDNQKLKKQLDDMYNQMIEFDKVKRENEELRKVIGLKEDFPDYEFSPPCAVIARTTNDPYGSFVIDKGMNDGIEAYDPVITSDGLVGIVTKVSKTYSHVRTIFSPETPVGAYCIRTEDTGVIEGSTDPEYYENGYCKMMYIDRDSEMKVGDIVVTSGNSGLFPVDRLIGTVEEIIAEDNGLSLSAKIKPAVDIDSVTNVFVITAFNGQGEGYEE